MKKHFKNILPVAFITMLGLFGSMKTAHGQPSSLHDSLRRMLTQIEKKTKNESLRELAQGIKKIYTRNVMNDFLSMNLLAVDRILISTKEIDKSIVVSYAETLVKVFKELPPKEEHPDYVGSLNHLAFLYWKMGRYRHALPLQQQALAINKKVLAEDDPDYANSINNLANLYLSMGQFDKALPLQQQALAINKKVLAEDDPDYANSINNLAFLYWSMGQFDKALPLYQQVIDIQKKVLAEDDPDYANSINNLANLYWDMGEFDKALPLQEQVLAIRKKVLSEDHPDYIMTLAFLYRNMGQYDKALPLYLRVLDIQKKSLGEDDPDYANSINNLANLYWDMGEFDKALPLFLKELAIRKKSLDEDHPDYANSLNNLAFLYWNKGQYDKALPLYLQVLDIQKKSLDEDHPDYANSLNNLAVLYTIMGQYDKALPLHLHSLSIQKKVLGENHPDYAKNLNGLGMLQYFLGNLTQAFSLFTEASNLTLGYLRKAYSTLSEQEKLNYLNKATSQFNFLPSLLFYQSTRPAGAINQLYCNELALKAMVLEDQQAVLSNIRKSGDSSAIQIYDQWRQNKSLIGKQLLLPIKERLPHLENLEVSTNLLERQLSSFSTAFRSQQLQSQTISVKDIAQKLQQGQAAIEFIRFENYYNKKWTANIIYAALLLLPQDSTVHFVPLCEEKQLRLLLTNFTGSDSANKGILVAGDVSDSLYKLIWKPLQPYLKGVHTVYYAPTGLLHRISFQSLRPDSTHYLIDNYQLNQVVSTRTLALPAEAVKKPQEASLWGNIDYGNITSVAAVKKKPSVRGEESLDSATSSFDFYAWDTRNLREEGWEALPGTKSEVDSISNMLLQAGVKARTNIGKAGSEEAFKALDGNSPQVVHFATHGFFLPVVKSKASEAEYLTGRSSFTAQQNPMFRSGLVLAGGNYAWTGKAPPSKKEDGILTAYEIAQMDLLGTDLVVMSACGTALGDLQGYEGVIGLQRAFKLAGVKQMLISLWPVNDKATMELMTLFYRHWLQGQTTREALRRAQLEMKKKYPSPYSWAAFVMVE